VVNTYNDGKLVGARPSFRGIEPNAAFEFDRTTNQPLKIKESASAALLAGLSAPAGHGHSPMCTTRR
jgi:hypothetical protein